MEIKRKITQQNGEGNSIAEKKQGLATEEKECFFIVHTAWGHM